MKRNDTETSGYCHRLIWKLKRERLDPLMEKLSAPDGASLTFKDITNVYDEIRKEYKEQSRGSKTLCTEMFISEFLPVCKDDCMDDRISRI